MSKLNNEAENSPKASKKLNTTQIIIIAGIVVVLAVVIVIGVLLLTRKPDSTVAASGIAATPGTGNVIVDEYNVDDTIAAMKEKAAEGSFEVKMNAGWSFPDGASPTTDAYVANSESNHKPFYFDVSLNDTDEIIYTSPVLQLGEAVKEFTLTKDLDAGTYDCICTYHTLNEDGTVADNIMVAVTIVINA